MEILVGIAEDIGLRETMEDDYAVHHRPDLNFFSAEVYDGHLGREPARLASEMLSPHFLDTWLREREKRPEDRLSDDLALREAYMAVDKYITHKRVQGGAAAATLHIMGEKFMAANAGDSRVIIGVRQGAEILTLDHKPHIAEERRRIEAAGGMITWLGIPRVMGFLAMSRALGDTSLKPFVTCEPRIASGLLGRENDYAVLACDGVWDVLTPDEVIDLARHSGDARKGADAIKDRALKVGSTDNITVLVLDLRTHTTLLGREKMEILTVLDMALPPSAEEPGK